MTLTLNKPVIAVTGSAGKTTTKEMIAAILQQRWFIYKTPGNKNFYRVSATSAKRILPQHQAAVLEFAMSWKGQIKKHCQFIQPNLGVITNVGTAHIGNVGSTIQGVADAKSELITNMKPTGSLVLNADDKNSRLLKTQGFRGKILTIGILKPATYQASNMRYAKNGMIFQVRLNGKTPFFFIPTFGVHNIYNALSAIAVAHQLGCSIKHIRTGLACYRRPYRRLTIVPLSKGIRLLDDSYSANPHAAKAALEVLSNLKSPRKIAVLGTMLAMGKYSQAGHREVGRYLAQKKIDALYTLGKPAKQIAIGACQAGFCRNKIKSFDSQSVLRKQLRFTLKPGTTILVKGSRGVKLDRTAEWLKDYAQAHFA